MAKDNKNNPPVDDELMKLRNDPRAGTMKSFIRETLQEWVEEEKEKQKTSNDDKSIFDIMFGR